MDIFKKTSLKKIFITTIVCCLVVAAAVGIMAILFGSFGMKEWRILGSSLAAGIFSITSLATVRHFESQSATYRYFAFATLVLSLIAMAFVQGIIWLPSSNEIFAKITLTISILAVSLAHVSLLLPPKNNPKIATGAAVATIMCIAYVAASLISLVNGQYGSDTLFRLLGVFVILDVLGTIVTPLLSKFMKSDKQLKRDQK